MEFFGVMFVIIVLWIIFGLFLRIADEFDDVYSKKHQEVMEKLENIEKELTKSKKRNKNE